LLTDTANHFDLSTAVFTDLNIDSEYSLESLLPNHGSLLFCRTLVVPVVIGRFWWTGLLATFTGVTWTRWLLLGAKITSVLPLRYGVLNSYGN